MVVGSLIVIKLVIEMAHDYSIETRIRRLLAEHQMAGDEPRTLVMNAETYRQLIWELGERNFRDGYFWVPKMDSPGQEGVSIFLGVPILIKDFMPDQEVIVGV